MFLVATTAVDIVAATDTEQDMAIADIAVEAAADTTATTEAGLAAGTDTTAQADTMAVPGIAAATGITVAARTMAAVATTGGLGQGPDLGMVAEVGADPVNITAEDQARGAAPVPLPRLPKAVPAPLVRKHGVRRLTLGISHEFTAESRLAVS